MYRWCLQLRAVNSVQVMGCLLARKKAPAFRDSSTNNNTWSKKRRWVCAPSFTDRSLSSNPSNSLGHGRTPKHPRGHLGQRHTGHRVHTCSGVWSRSLGRRLKGESSWGPCGRSESRRAWTDRCLLYTSPSPRDLSTSRMPSSA